jgi:transposase
MRAKSDWAPGPSVRVVGVELVSGGWVVSAVGQASGLCPGCGDRSTGRHGWHRRDLQDLPVQGSVVTLRLRLIRWRCRNAACERQTFVDQLPEITSPHARRTCRVAEIVQLLGHGVGGLPGERLMNRLGMPVSDDTILRLLKLRASARGAITTLRVAGIDDWSWRKAAPMGPLLWIWNGGKSSTCCRAAQPREWPNGLASILRSKSSAAIVAACMRRAHARARRRRGRSPIASISCRTFGRLSRPN